MTEWSIKNESIRLNETTKYTKRNEIRSINYSRQNVN